MLVSRDELGAEHSSALRLREHEYTLMSRSAPNSPRIQLSKITTLIESYARRRATGDLWIAQGWACGACYISGMDTREAGRLGAAATNKKLSKKKRKENARKAAQVRWSK